MPATPTLADAPGGHSTRRPRPRRPRPTRPLPPAIPTATHHGHHHHGPGTHDRAFAIGAGVNLAFAVGEIGFGFATNSVALIADAIHNLGDVLGLLLGWMAVWLHRRPPTPRRTYGWGRFSILAAFGNAAILLVSVGAIGIEALHRLHKPVPVASGHRHGGSGVRHPGQWRLGAAVPARPPWGPEHPRPVPASRRRRRRLARRRPRGSGRCA